MSESSVCQPEGSEFEFYLGRQTNPTSSDCALPVDSQPTGFSGNGQFVGNLALLKKTLRAVERPKSALSGPPGASLSLSPTWRARLVNSRSCGLHLDERRFSQTSVVGARRLKVRH